MKLDPAASPLLTDLYQLTMLQAYRLQGLSGVASFELFVRKLPRERSLLVVTGLDPLLDWLEHLRFADTELEWLARSQLFRAEFVDWLAGLRFRGDVDAMDEGTIAFAEEPILRVSASLPEAQLIESRLVNVMHLHTLVASKAVRSVLVAPDKRLVDFGMRRAHGSEAALAAARSAYLAGFAGTATTLAAPMHGIPVFGTMAHAFVQANVRELDAFVAFARAFPENAVLLIDTYDTESGARMAVEAARLLAQDGIRIKGVRLDSGDLAALSRSVRSILDAAGLTDALVFASGNLDEYRVQALERAGAPIDAYGIGTHLVTSADAPSLDMVYKLQQYEGRPTRKRSTGKATWPGEKQVFRFFDAEGRFAHDELVLAHEHRTGEPLLHPVMREGARTRPRIPLETIRTYAAQQREQLPERLREIDGRAAYYHVVISEALTDLADALDRGAVRA